MKLSRRIFLKGLGAAFATVAIVTRSGQTNLTDKLGSSVSPFEGDFNVSELRYKATERARERKLKVSR